jgi:hypothetical protein
MPPLPHCRGCSLSVWVATSGIKAIQVIDEGRGVVRVVEIAMGGRPKGYGGRAEPSIIKARVESGK